MIAAFVHFYSMIVLVAVLVSWLRLPPTNPLQNVLDTLTEPALKPLRKILPPAGGLDFSPIILLLGLQALGRFLRF